MPPKTKSGREYSTPSQHTFTTIAFGIFKMTAFGVVVAATTRALNFAS